MAIQLRRGAYADFDPAKMLPGEMAVVLSGDPAASAGRSVYVCFEAGVVKRFTTYEDFESELQSTAEEVREVFTADIQQAISNTIAATKAANDAAAATQQAQAAAEAAAEAAEAAAEAAGAYILGDISDKTVTFQVAAARANIQSGDSLAIAFGKLAKFYADVKSHAFVDTVRNLAATEGGRALDAIMGAELAGRIGNLDSLPTANKSSLVAAISEQNTNMTNVGKPVNLFATTKVGYSEYTVPDMTKCRLILFSVNDSSINFYPAIVVTPYSAGAMADKEKKFVNINVVSGVIMQAVFLSTTKVSIYIGEAGYQVTMAMIK